MGLRVIFVEKFVENHADDLNGQGNDHQNLAGAEYGGVQVNQTGFQDIAGDDHIDAQIGQAPSPRLIHDAQLFDQSAH